MDASFWDDCGGDVYTRPKNHYFVNYKSQKYCHINYSLSYFQLIGKVQC